MYFIRVYKGSDLSATLTHSLYSPCFQGKKAWQKAKISATLTATSPLTATFFPVRSFGMPVLKIFLGVFPLINEGK